MYDDWKIDEDYKDAIEVCSYIPRMSKFTEIILTTLHFYYVYEIYLSIDIVPSCCGHKDENSNLYKNLILSSYIIQIISFILICIDNHKNKNKLCKNLSNVIADVYIYSILINFLHYYNIQIISEHNYIVGLIIGISKIIINLLKFITKENKITLLFSIIASCIQLAINCNVSFVRSNTSSMFFCENKWMKNNFGSFCNEGKCNKYTQFITDNSLSYNCSTFICLTDPVKIFNSNVIFGSHCIWYTPSETYQVK